MELTGKIKLIEETQTFDSGFTKRIAVLTTNEQYPQDIKIEFVKDKCDVLNNYKVGQDVTIGINLRGNEYNNKYYVNIVGWRISASDEQQAPQQKENAFDVAEGDDSLPF